MSDNNHRRMTLLREMERFNHNYWTLQAQMQELDHGNIYRNEHLQKLRSMNRMIVVSIIVAAVMISAAIIIAALIGRSAG